MQIKHYFEMKEIYAAPLGIKTECNYIFVETESAVWLKCRLIFKTSGGELRTEVFPVKRGKGKYTGFISSLKGGENAVELVEIVCFNLENAKGLVSFGKIGFESKARPNAKAEVFNEYLRFGVDSDYGNSLTFLTSEKYTTEIENGSLKFKEKENKRGINLLNRYEKSRSFAQNFYGALNPPYSPSLLFGGLWKYNPVQGGDFYGNNSELLDFYADDKKVRLKIKPLDRAKNGEACDSVMETEYSLSGKLLKMSCEFFDYSMFDHRWGKLRAQEMPSLYVNPLLGRFLYVKDKSLTARDNLGYWAEMPYKSEQHFIVTGGWSAWVNEDGYGVGIFSPHTKHHYAGRLAIKGETLGGDDTKSTSYTAPIGYFDLKNLDIVKYDCYLTVGHFSEIRKTFDELDKNLRRGRER